METKTRVHVIVRGRVQGVYFRLETQRAAEGQGIFGWVRNRADGTVEAVFEGDKKNVDAIVDWCRRGPRHAIVEGIEMKVEPYSGEFKEFSILY